MKLCGLTMGIVGRFPTEFDGTEMRGEEVIEVRVDLALCFGSFFPLNCKRVCFGRDSFGGEAGGS